MLSPAASRLSIVAAALLWSTAGVGIKLVHLDAWGIASGRSLVAAATMFLLMKRTRVRPSLRVLAVAASYAATVILFVLATKLTTAANAIFLQDTAPLYVLLLSPWLLGEHPSRSELFAVPIFGLGLALFFFDQLSPGQLNGNLIALGSGVTFAAMIIGLRKLGEEATVAVAWGNVLAAAVALPFALGNAVPSGTDLLWLAYLGSCQLGLAYALFTRGLLGTKAIEASLLVLLEPVLNPVWVFLLAEERPGPWAIAGGTTILVATLWRTLIPTLGPRRAANAIPPLGS